MNCIRNIWYWLITEILQKLTMAEFFSCIVCYGRVDLRLDFPHVMITFGHKICSRCFKGLQKKCLPQFKKSFLCKLII